MSTVKLALPSRGGKTARSVPMVPFLLFGPQGLRRGCRDYVPFPFTATVCFPGSWRNNSLAMGVPREEGGWTLRNGTGRYTLLWALATDVSGLSMGSFTAPMEGSPFWRRRDKEAFPRVR